MHSTITRRHSWPAALMIIIAVMTSCSTTSHLPEGDQLYTGASIDYKGTERSLKSDKDSAGVIKSIAGAVREVSGGASGKTGFHADGCAA